MWLMTNSLQVVCLLVVNCIASRTNRFRRLRVGPLSRAHGRPTIKMLSEKPVPTTAREIEFCRSPRRDQSLEPLNFQRKPPSWRGNCSAPSARTEGFYRALQGSLTEAGAIGSYRVLSPPK